MVVLAAEKAAGIVREAARAGISQMVLVNELDPVPAPQQSRLARAAEAARKAGIRLFAVPSGGLDGVFGQPENRAPACAYVGQSAGIADCVAAYAAERRITFSRFLTVCPQDYPADMGQIIDFTASEPAATALLVHICSPENPRNLVSALAAAARRKPVVVLATLADAEEEALLMQALARVHVLTAHTLAQFFSAAKLIHTGLVCRGKSIAVVSNSPQICTLALKTLPAAGLHLAESTPTLARAAAKLLPYRPAAANPLYLPADALPAQFQAALSLHLEDDKSDAVLAVYTGTDAEESLQTAQMAAALQRKSKKPLLAAWLGSANTDDVRTLFGRNRTLHFKQPEHALPLPPPTNSGNTSAPCCPLPCCRPAAPPAHISSPPCKPSTAPICPKRQAGLRSAGTSATRSAKCSPLPHTGTKSACCPPLPPKPPNAHFPP